MMTISYYIALVMMLLSLVILGKDFGEWGKERTKKTGWIDVFAFITNTVLWGIVFMGW